MTNPQVLNEKFITMSELKDELKKIKKRDEELNFRANKTEEYLNSVIVLKKKDADELRKKLEDLKIPRLKEEHIVKTIDVLPASQEEVRVMMQGYVTNLTADQMKKIAEVVKDFVPKK